MSRVCRLAGVWSLVLAAACGGGSPTPPTPPGPPTGPAPTTETLSGSVAVYGIASHSVQAARAGTMTMTLTWTGAVDLDLYVTAPDCTGYPPDTCVILHRSTASTGAREEVIRTVAAGERLLVWIDNFSTTSAAPYTLVLTLSAP